MSDDLRRLAARIRNELVDIEHVVGRVREGWQRARLRAELLAFADFLEYQT